MLKYITDKKYMLLLLVIILCVILVFIGIIIWPEMNIRFGATAEISQITPTITATPTELPTNFPPVIRDYFENQNGTNGLLIGSVVLVLIILLGVLISIRNNEK